MQNYLNLLEDVIEHGYLKENRTGIDTLSIFGTKLEYNHIYEKFPLLTTKKMFWKGILGELLWFLRGETNIKFLKDNNIHIWDAWADPETLEVGPVYGYQWRNWGGQGIDQLQEIVDKIKNNPFDRRMILSAWNVSDIPQMHLPPCHMFAQFYVRIVGEKKYLDCQVYQRSADLFLGVPFDIASYATLMHIIGYLSDSIPDKLVYVFGDTHVYVNHIDVVKEQIQRIPYELPVLKIDGLTGDLFSGADNNGIYHTKINKTLNDFTFDDFKVEGYKYYPALKAEVAV